jgi:hypothetical protein
LFKPELDELWPLIDELRAIEAAEAESKMAAV